MSITAWGHSNVLAQHRTTFQTTTESELTAQGDCIIAVRASHAAKDLPDDLKNHLKMGKQISIILTTRDHTISITGFGHPTMTLSHVHDMVFRRSNFVDSRTVAVGCSMTAIQLPRNMIQHLGSSQNQLLMSLEPLPEE